MAGVAVRLQMFAEILLLHCPATSHTSTSTKTARASEATTTAVRLAQGGATWPCPRRQLAAPSAVCAQSVRDLLLRKASETGDFDLARRGSEECRRKMILASQLLATPNVGPHVIEPDIKPDLRRFG